MKSTVKSEAAQQRWAVTRDRSAATAPARAAAFARFERLADPEGVLTPEERHERALQLRNEHMAEMSRKAVAARIARAEAKTSGESR